MMNPLPTGNAALAVAYRRTSSVDQGKRFGPVAQSKTIAAFAEREGLGIVADFFDDVSGTLPLDERPGLTAALAAVREFGAGVLLVPHRDRLARDEYAAYDAIRAFELAGAKVLFAEGANGEDGELSGGLEIVVTAWERRRIVKRLRRGREDAADRHPDARKQGGRVPLGYRRTPDGLEIDPDAAEQVRAAFALARAGKSQRSIAKQLALSPATVGGVLMNPIYKQAKPGRVIDPRIWNAVRKMSAARYKRTDLRSAS